VTPEISELKAAYEAALDVERTAAKATRDARDHYHAALIEQYPIKVDNVLVNKKYGKRIIVRKVYVRYAVMRVKYSPQNSGGAWSKREIELYDNLSNWEVEK
jgi:hypothetical protein